MFRQGTGEIDVVLCDLSMPKMNGVDAMKNMRSIRPDIPVILTSGHIESHALAGAQEHPPAGFLHKPYRRSELKAALEQALRSGPSA